MNRRFLPHQAPTTSTDLSETRPDVVKPREAAWVKRQREGEMQSVEAMAILQQISQHLGSLTTFAKAPPLNDVMYSGARIIPAAGFDVLEFPTRWSAISVANLSPSLLSHGSSAVGGSPGAGAGVVRIPPGTFRTWNGRGDGSKIFGQPGSTYDLTVYQRPRQPSSGICGRSQGGILLPAGMTTTATSTFSGSGLKHIAAVLNVSAVAGGTVQVTLNGVTPSGYIYPLLVGLAVNAVGVTPYRIGPALTPSPNAVANDLVPAQFQAVVTVTGSATYGVDLVAG
jgi:hypothetical protein